MDFMVVSSDDYQRFLDNSDRYPDEASAYNRFFAEHKLVYRLVADAGRLNGPTISVYRVAR
jgi:hypothetical protein